MAKQQSHVPTFGNWEEQRNAPYTAYFDNARAKKAGGKLVNPNDPSENPEAFSSHASPMQSGSGSDPSVLNPNQNQRDRNEGVRTSRDQAHLTENVKKQGRTGATPNRSPIHPGRTKVKATGRGDDMLEAGSAVPKFGDWDKDPSSADGYTGIFDKVREEKQTGSSKSPMITDDSIYYSSAHNSSNKSSAWSCFGWCK